MVGPELRSSTMTAPELKHTTQAEITIASECYMLHATLAELMIVPELY